MAPEPQYTVAGIRVAEITVGAGEYAERIVRERTAPRPAPAD